MRSSRIVRGWRDILVYTPELSLNSAPHESPQMNHKLSALAVALPLLVGAGLTACGSPSTEAPCEGQWDLEQMSMNGEVVGEEEMAQLESLGLTIELTMDADGAAELLFLGEAETGTWRATSSGCVLEFAGEEIPVGVSGDALTMEDSGSVVTFARTQ